MSTPRSPQRTEWQPARIPKLSYRNALPQDELDKISHAPREQIPSTKNLVQTTSIRETAGKSATTSSGPPASKKKNSFLSGFFSKEPTISALAQVEADLMAKHGAANPQSVPHVSSRKMPQHVPKVNSRWDGIPESVKMRDREEKQRRKFSQRSNYAPPSQSIHSQSSIGSIQSQDEKLPDSRRTGSLSSAVSSTNSRTADSHQAASVKSQSLRSSSRPNPPEITAFFPQYQHNKAIVGTNQVQQVKNGRNPPPKAVCSRPSETFLRESRDYGRDMVPEHSFSPIATPREMSPVTPVYRADREASPRINAVEDEETGAGTTKATSKRVKHLTIDAFLAGEARLLELDDDDHDDDAPSPREISNPATRRPRREPSEPIGVKAATKSQSSRGRSELRAYGVVRSEVAPWEAQAPPISRP